MTAQSDPVIDYIRPTTAPPPGPIARWSMKPLPWWFWAASVLAFLAIIALARANPFDPETYYLWPVAALLRVGPAALVVFGTIGLTRAIARRRHRVDLDRFRREPLQIVIALIACTVLTASPLSLRIGALVRLHSLNSIQQRVTAGTMSPGPVVVAPFRFTGTERYDNGIVILYTDGGPGFFPGSGNGLLYLPDGVEFPGYNQGSDGHLVGNWYWFVTD